MSHQADKNSSLARWACQLWLNVPVVSSRSRYFVLL